MSPCAADPFLPDGRYAWQRCGLATLAGTLAGAGMWCLVVVMPAVQAEFGVARADVSLPYTAMMLGVAFGTVVLGRVADRVGIVLPLMMAGLAEGLGFVLAGLAPNLALFSTAHFFLIGLGAGMGFAPMMADISHWFVKRRGLAVVMVASGNYLAGTLWPQVIKALLPHYGWRSTYIVIGILIGLAVVPLALAFRRRLPHAVMVAADAQSGAARSGLGLSAARLQALLVVAGFACCVAMAMPQVHLVSYCGDLGYGVARGAEMLSFMLFLGILSRLGSGYVADRIGGAATLALGSLMQGLALTLYLFFDGLASLYVISGIFGLFQGGIVPMYAVISREFLPAREAGARIGLVIAATICGMAFGGWVSGFIFDMTRSYRLAFLNGVAWNALNLVIALWLTRRGSAQLAGARAG